MREAVKIGVDLDGTLADYQREVLKFVNKYYHKSYKFNEIKRDDCYDILSILNTLPRFSVFLTNVGELLLIIKMRT